MDTFVFSIGDRVMIQEISTPGKVRVCRRDKDGITYLVTYWWEGKLQEVWLNEDELKSPA